MSSMLNNREMYEESLKNGPRTGLKNKIENNSTWGGAFYQSEWVKINSSWVTLVFSLYVLLHSNLPRKLSNFIFKMNG